ncbi:luciferin 4-monooxygenase-like [Trichoplusia ni]|uniref:Luciferin 4-monooxygenase-like n=1 Tax=Trichoplusia ni TaxID=7111 RepID=A0A7E5VI29_TRINI|nr:luciferin 4-monooxygenase-like [Trichoplusia ni]
MDENLYRNSALDKYMSEITSRVAAESGIPSDRYHLGKLVLQSLRDDEDFVMQVDGATDTSETNGAVLQKSVRCATCFRSLGLKTGDVMVLMAPNHLDQAVPFYAALFEGIIIAPIDRTLGVNELQATFSVDKPSIVFCQSEKVKDVQKAIELADATAKVFSYDTSPDTISLAEMLEKYGEDVDVKDFQAADFDTEKTISVIVSTSGTTGLPKASILTHKNTAISGPYAIGFSQTFPCPIKSAILVSPMQWLSSFMHYILSPILKYTRVQSSTLTPEHLLDMIIKYEPSFCTISPPLMLALLKETEKKKCDFSSFDVIYIGGSSVPTSLVEEVQRLTPRSKVADSYGISEVGSIVFYSLDGRKGSCGRRFAHLEYKLVDTETNEEIKEPHVVGELWVRIPGYFQGYYNNPEVSAEVTTSDKWFKTGDLMYRDEDWYFYFVDRHKLLLKYKNHQISPAELEAVIRQHPSVSDVAVAGVPDPESGELPIAFVVTKPGAKISEQEVKDIVKDNLTDTKHLRGGVVFVEELPLTVTAKVDRKKLKELVQARVKGGST